MAGGRKVGVPPALGLWLIAVAAVRVALTLSGFFDASALRAATYSHTQMTAVHGRTFGVWTLLSCTITFLCAFNLENKPLYAATFLSFVYAYGHFVVEHLIYHTFPAANLATFGFLAVTSMVWMLLRWNSYGPHSAKQS